MTDTSEPIDADIDISADTDHIATVGDTVMMVTAEGAAGLAGVSVRTIRRWIQQGHLPYIESESGKLVSPADIPMARQRAGRGYGRSHVTTGSGHDRGHDDMATDTDTAMAATLSHSATAQMGAIRDEWLRPLVDRIEELSRENGRLEQERDSLRSELDRVRAESVKPEHAPQDANTAPPRDDAPHMASVTLTEASVAPASDAESLAARVWRAITGH